MAGIPDSVRFSVSVENRGICSKCELLQLDLDGLLSNILDKVTHDSNIQNCERFKVYVGSSPDKVGVKLSNQAAQTETCSCFGLTQTIRRSCQ